jgi:hypothetical protein
MMYALLIGWQMLGRTNVRLDKCCVGQMSGQRGGRVKAITRLLPQSKIWISLDMSQSQSRITGLDLTIEMKSRILDLNQDFSIVET